MRRGAVAVAFVAVAYALAPAPPLLSPCAWQADHCARTYGFVRDHYETDRYAPDLGNWGVPYRAYADAFLEIGSKTTGNETNTRAKLTN